MEITLPTDCGNAPRVGIVTDFVVNWARADAAAVAAWLADRSAWRIVGGDTHHGTGAAEETAPRIAPRRMELFAVITHGRLASCDGYLEDGERRLEFSHTFRFASTAKTARIAELRTYCIETEQQ